MDSENDKTVTWNSIIPSLLKDGPSDTDDSSSNALPRGTRMGAFEIVNVIGEGGFGIVYHAYDHHLERHVALKEYMPSGLASRSRTMVVTVKSQENMDTFEMGLKSFINEARLLAQFDAPSLVKVFQFWEANSTAYMVMPYYKGVTLKQAWQAIKASPTESWMRSFLANLFDAVEIIHHVNCYHRDIAPDNILLLENNRPLLLDFGAARRVIGDRTQGPTAILKPGFAPIEQYADIPGLKQGPWTDIYALGAVVYYLISGKTPVAAVSRTFNDTLVPAQQAGKGRYSPGFLAAVDHALAVRPENRIQTIDEFRNALSIGENVPSTLPPWTSGSETTKADKWNGSVKASRFEKKEPWLDNPDSDETRLVGEPVRIDPVMPKGAERTIQPSPPELPKPTFTGRKTAIAAIAALAVVVAGGTVLWKRTDHADDMRRVGSAPSIQEGSTPSLPSTAATAQTDPGGAGTNTQPQLPTELPGDRKKMDAQPKVSGPASAPPSSPILQPVTPDPATPPIVLGLPSPSPSPSPSPLPPQGPSPREQAKLSVEDEKWQQTVTANDIASYKDYLQIYPKGRYANIAKASLKRLEKQDIASHSPQPAINPGTLPGKMGEAGNSSRDENIAWNNTAAKDTLSAYELFVKDFPAGQHAAEARTRIAALTKKLSPLPMPTQPPATIPAQPAGSEDTTAKRSDPKLAPVQDPAKAPPTPGGPNSGPKPKAVPDGDAHGDPQPEVLVSSKPPPSPPPDNNQRAGSKPFRVNDQVYIGTFTADPVSGALSGKGKITWDNGDQYEGTVVRGLREGKGEFIWANGQRYKGEWLKGAPNGRGAMEFANGQKYNGDWVKGVPDGRGTMEFANGYKYNGDMRDGEANGKGTLTFGNGDRYIGEVKNGLQNGHGTTRFTGGDTHVGEWRNGKKVGRGRYTWANGDYWEGEYVDDKQTENGKLVRATPGGPIGSASSAGQDNDASEDVAQKR